MPKFSSVQAYSDNNSNVQAVTYDQATGGHGKAEKVKTEKVMSAYGSTAGANSGEFHVYRQARAREMSRMETLRTTEEERQKELEFQRTVEENKRQAEERTAKRRKKRQRQKDAKRRKENLLKAGVTLQTPSVGDSEEEDSDDDNPFAVAEMKATQAPQFANDGSFLALMQQKLAEENKSGKDEVVENCVIKQDEEEHSAK